MDSISEYEIKIEFETKTKDPANIFYAMGDLINSINYFDNVILEVLPFSCESVVELQSIEIGSIKSKLKTILLKSDDEAIRDFDWKKQVGSFLLKAKYKAIKWLEDKDSIENKDEIMLLTDDINSLAKEEMVEYTSTFEISPKKLLESIEYISKSMTRLGNNQKAIYISAEGSAIFNKNLLLTSKQIEEIITEREIISVTESICEVKKPDYIGKSMWEFYLDEKHIKVVFDDDGWLNKFQSGQIDLRPGDSMEIILESTIHLDENNSLVEVTYRLLKVNKIIKHKKTIQMSFLD